MFFFVFAPLGALDNKKKLFLISKYLLPYGLSIESGLGTPSLEGTKCLRMLYGSQTGFVRNKIKIKIKIKKQGTDPANRTLLVKDSTRKQI